MDLNRGKLEVFGKKQNKKKNKLLVTSESISVLGIMNLTGCRLMSLTQFLCLAS